MGKRVGEYPLYEDQKHILNEILEIILREKADGLIISGDVYDKSMPSGEAVGLMDEFLSKLCETGCKLYMISGNHDSAERVAYGESVFKRQGIHISPVFGGEVMRAEAFDEYGRVNIYLLPFVRLAQIKKIFPECEAENCTEALKFVVERLNIDKGERNVILAHQFITGASAGGSEEINVGTLDGADADVFEGFDYAALGHIHRAQKAGLESVRYAGSPLKYSASEAGQSKSVTAVELKEKGNVKISLIKLHPLRDFKEIKGRLDDVLALGGSGDFVRITLTDEEGVVDAYGKLKEKYPYMTEIVFERQTAKIRESGVKIEETPEEQFAVFFEQQNGKPLTTLQLAEAAKIFSEVRE